MAISFRAYNCSEVFLKAQVFFALKDFAKGFKPTFKTSRIRYRKKKIV